MKWLKISFAIILFFFFTACLTQSFFRNSLGVAEQSWFEGYQHDTEAHVIGRIVISRSEGLFSHGGLTGVGVRQQPNSDLDRAWPGKRIQDYQYEAFIDGAQFKYFDPYMSQPGMQAILFSIADRILPLSNKAKLSTFYYFTSLVSAAVLSAVLLWIFFEVGPLAAVFAGLSMLASQWLCVFGRNLWWSLWSFYVPMVLLMSLLALNPAPKCKYRWLALTVFLGFLAKCLLTGYEYMTTTFVMGVLPLLWHQIKVWPGWKRFVLQWMVTGVACFAAVFVTMLILCLQIGSVKTGFSDGIDHLRFSFGKRSHGSVEIYPRGYEDSLEADPIDQVKKYNRGVFMDPSNQPWVKDEEESRTSPVLYNDLLKLFGVVSAAVILLLCVPFKSLAKRRLFATLILVWVSLLAPYSWFIIFTAHSYIHHHMNYITWQMPFTIFGFALIGIFLEQSGRAVWTAVGLIRNHYFDR